MQLNRQLGLVETLLDTSETRIAEQQTTIASLGQRLEQALIDRSRSSRSTARSSSAGSGRFSAIGRR
jgi:hypothetical protein